MKFGEWLKFQKLCIHPLSTLYEVEIELIFALGAAVSDIRAQVEINLVFALQAVVFEMIEIFKIAKYYA